MIVKEIECQLGWDKFLSCNFLAIIIIFLSECVLYIKK